MPRHSRREESEVYPIGQTQQTTVGPPIHIIQAPEPPTIIVESFLKNNYWDMLQKIEKVNECSVCLEDIKCKNCFTLLMCGHTFHLCCITRCQPNWCPICRKANLTHD